MTATGIPAFGITAVSDQLVARPWVFMDTPYELPRDEQFVSVEVVAGRLMVITRTHLVSYGDGTSDRRMP